MIERDYYLKQLISKKGNGMIKVITGIRRCGKSTLLFEIYHNYLISIGIQPNQIIELSLMTEEKNTISNQHSQKEMKRNYFKRFALIILLRIHLKKQLLLKTISFLGITKTVSCMLVLRNSCLIQPLLIIKLYFVNKVTELQLIRIKLFLPYNQPILYLMSQ